MKTSPFVIYYTSLVFYTIWMQNCEQYNGEVFFCTAPFLLEYYPSQESIISLLRSIHRSKIQRKSNYSYRMYHIHKMQKSAAQNKEIFGRTTLSTNSPS